MPSIIKTSILSAGIVSAAVLRRDARTLSTDLVAVNTGLIDLTTAANAYNGGLFGAIPVGTAENKVAAAIGQANTDAQATERLDSANTKTLIDYINNTLDPNIEKILAALSGKKDKWDAANMGPMVAGDISNLHNLTLALGNTLVNDVASADQKPDGQAALTQIDGYFVGAEKVWTAPATASAAPAASATSVKAASLSF